MAISTGSSKQNGYDFSREWNERLGFLSRLCLVPFFALAGVCAR